MHIALSEGLGFRVCVCVRERERESESQRKLNFFLLHSREAFQYSHWPTLFLYIFHIYREREVQCIRCSFRESYSLYIYMCMCVYICMHVYIFIYAYIYTHTRVYIRIHIYMYTHAHTHTHTHTRVFICTFRRATQPSSGHKTPRRSIFSRERAPRCPNSPRRRRTIS